MSIAWFYFIVGKQFPDYINANKQYIIFTIIQSDTDK